MYHAGLGYSPASLWPQDYSLHWVCELLLGYVVWYYGIVWQKHVRSSVET
jgi:hypothetical protein